MNDMNRILHPMRKIITVVFGLMLLIQSAMAQDDKNERADRLQAAKVAYITTKLNLNTQQAQQFWPIFNEFETSSKRIRKQLKQLRVDNALTNHTDAEITADIRKMFTLRQEELDLEKSYSDKFLKVISPSQLANFYRSEKEFTQLLIQRLGGRDGKRGRGPGPGSGGKEMDDLEGR